MTRLILDCTHTFRTGAYTGIQRVVRQFADTLLELGPSFGVDVVPARVAGKGWMPLPLAGGRVAFPRAASAREAPIEHPYATYLYGIRAWGHRANRLLRSRAVSSWLDGGPNENALERLLTRKTSPAGALQAARDDIVFSVDSSWVYDIRSPLDAAGAAGATRIAALHDVLPLSGPQWFDPGTARYFGAWLKELLPRLDGVIGFSANTCRELRAVAESHRITRGQLPPCAAVHLGAEIAPAGGEVRPSLRALIGPGRRPALLTVGTIEPRKNVDFALDILDRLAARGVDFQWHIVGAEGWLSSHTAQRIREHPLYGDRLRWWTDLDDGELAWAYRNAAALVAVSKAEGFGLPLVEARFCGLPVIASDIPVFREILRSEGRFLPLSNAALAAAALEDFLAGVLPVPDRKDASRVVRNWKESGRELLETLLRMHAARR